MSRWVNPVLDGFLAQPGSAAYNLTRNIPIDTDFIGNAVGDKIGLYRSVPPPLPPLRGGRERHSNNDCKVAAASGYNASLDLVVARQALDHYILVAAPLERRHCDARFPRPSHT